MSVTAQSMENNVHCFICLQMESGQGDLGTLANVVTSLANLSDSLKENLNNGDTSDCQHEEQSASEITRSVQSAVYREEGCVCDRHLKWNMFVSENPKMVKMRDQQGLRQGFMPT